MDPAYKLVWTALSVFPATWLLAWFIAAAVRRLKRPPLLLYAAALALALANFFLVLVLGRGWIDAFVPHGTVTATVVCTASGSLSLWSVVDRSWRTRRGRPYRCDACGHRSPEAMKSTPGESSGGMYGLQGRGWQCGRCGHITWTPS